MPKFKPIFAAFASGLMAAVQAQPVGLCDALDTAMKAGVGFQAIRGEQQSIRGRPLPNDFESRLQVEGYPSCRIDFDHSDPASADFLCRLRFREISASESALQHYRTTLDGLRACFSSRNDTFVIIDEEQDGYADGQSTQFKVKHSGARQVFTLRVSTMSRQSGASTSLRLQRDTND